MGHRGQQRSALVVKRTTLSALALAAFIGTSCFTATALAQNAASQESAPHKIGLIDMAEVFNKYKKFEALREDLKVEIEAADRQAKALANQAKKVSDQLKSDTYKEGSPEYQQKENELIQLQTQFQSFKAQAQRDFVRKESQIYKTVYLEVADAVDKYANYYQYTLILRFSRKDLEEDENPQKVLQGMNRQVIYHRPEDDITDSVVHYLNQMYDRSQGNSSARNPKSGTSRR